MRRPGVCLEVAFDLRGRQCTVEGVDVRRRDARVVATKETEDGRAHARRLFSRDRPDFVLALAEPAIEADDARETGLLRRGQERDASAEAEAQDENTTSLCLCLQLRAACGDVREDALRRRLPDVWHVFEVVGAPVHPCGAPEVIEGDRVNAGGREPVGQILIERVQPPYVWRDDDARLALICAGEMRAELGSVRARQRHFLPARSASHRRKKIKGNVGRSSTRRITHGGPPRIGFRMLAQDG